jgi:hypothetical protein
MTLSRVRAISQPIGLSLCYLINRENPKTLHVIAAQKHSIVFQSRNHLEPSLDHRRRQDFSSHLVPE